jgi:integrase
MHVATFALNYAENLELIDHSPARKFKMYKENPVERRSLTADEEKKLLEACKISKNKILYHVVMIALYTGMRSSEILNIKWSHVSLNEMSIRIYKSKNNESREIPIIDLLKPVFFDLKSITGGNEYVISSCYGEKINSVKKSYNQAVKNADIGHFTFHELRHTLVTRLASSGASILEIQQISGHKSESMVRRYTHVGLKESRRTIERLEKHLSSE